MPTILMYRLLFSTTESTPQKKKEWVGGGYSFQLLLRQLNALLFPTTQAP